MNLNLISFFVAFIVTIGITTVVKNVALSLKILDHPDRRKIHNHPMPLLGSIAVYLGIFITFTLFSLNPSFHREPLVIFLTGTFLLSYRDLR